MLDFLTRKAKEILGEVKKLENRDLMRACIASSILVAFADNSLDDSEIAKLHEVIESQPQLSVFGTEVGTTVDEYIGAMKASKYMGRATLMQRIENVKANRQEAEQVFAIALTIAEADGKVEATEKKVLADIGRKLGINPKDWGLE